MAEFGTFLYENWMLFAALVVILGLLLHQTLGGGSGSVSPQEATRLINHEDARILDVREPSEVKEGTLRGAVTIPLGQLDDRLSELGEDQETPIICYCRSGARSAQACAKLRKKGFSAVHNLQGGIAAWQQAGLPLARGKDRKKKG